MDKYINQRTASLLLIPGAVIAGLSMLINMAMVFSVYNKAGSCLTDADACDVGTEQIVSKVMLAVGIVGFVMLAAGIVLFVASRARQKPRPQKGQSHG
jgi:hypothetical protein